MIRPVHLRLIVPADLHDAVLGIVDHDQGVASVSIHHGAARRPPGDLLLVDVVPEAADRLISALTALGLAEHGSISVEHAELGLSARARDAADAVDGDAAEAVLWPEVDHEMRANSTPTLAYLTFLVLAALLATIALVTDSIVLIVGAMVIGPEYGPIASFAYGLWRRDWSLARRGLTTFAVGAATGVAAAAVLALGLRAAGRLGDYSPANLRSTGFVARPDLFSVIVALIAGVAGILALTQARSGLLVGVFISVTTIPAIADIGVGLVHWRRNETLGALAQLAVNVACIIVAGAATLAAQHRYLRGLGRRA